MTDWLGEIEKKCYHALNLFLTEGPRNSCYETLRMARVLREMGETINLLTGDINCNQSASCYCDKCMAIPRLSDDAKALCVASRDES